MFMVEELTLTTLTMQVAAIRKLTDRIAELELTMPGGEALPAWQPGAHVRVSLPEGGDRAYSLIAFDAARQDGGYRIAVQLEPEGLGGSRFMHGLKVGDTLTVSPPKCDFPLDAKSPTLLLAGGIGITPMIAMAHRLHAIGADFAMHYSVKSREAAGYLDDLANVPWHDRVYVHVTAEGTRADLDHALSGYEPGWHVYTCGPDRYMQGVTQAAERQGFPEEARHLEYFSVPELPEWENHPFRLKLAKSGREFLVQEDQTAADVLNENGFHIDIKCSDGICGVCKCGLVSGEVEHRDFVLSKKQRETAIILCQSRAAEDGGIIEIDL